MKLKDYIKDLVELLTDNPKNGDLEVWNFTDDEGNSIRPCDGGITEGYVGKNENLETDGYVVKVYLPEYLDDLNMDMSDFLEDNKPIILI